VECVLKADAVLDTGSYWRRAWGWKLPQVIL